MLNCPPWSPRVLFARMTVLSRSSACCIIVNKLAIFHCLKRCQESIRYIVALCTIATDVRFPFSTSIIGVTTPVICANINLNVRERVNWLLKRAFPCHFHSLHLVTSFYSPFATKVFSVYKAYCCHSDCLLVTVNVQKRLALLDFATVNHMGVVNQTYY